MRRHALPHAPMGITCVFGLTSPARSRRRARARPRRSSCSRRPPSSCTLHTSAHVSTRSAPTLCIPLSLPLTHSHTHTSSSCFSLPLPHPPPTPHRPRANVAVAVFVRCRACVPVSFCRVAAPTPCHAARGERCWALPSREVDQPCAASSRQALCLESRALARNASETPPSTR